MLDSGDPLKSKQKLTGKVVFITGGNAGLGKACAIQAAKEGAKIYLASDDSSCCKGTQLILNGGIMY